MHSIEDLFDIVSSLAVLPKLTFYLLSDVSTYLIMADSKLSCITEDYCPLTLIFIALNFSLLGIVTIMIHSFQKAFILSACTVPGMLGFFQKAALSHFGTVEAFAIFSDFSFFAPLFFLCFSLLIVTHL